MPALDCGPQRDTLHITSREDRERKTELKERLRLGAVLTAPGAHWTRGDRRHLPHCPTVQQRIHSLCGGTCYGEAPLGRVQPFHTAEAGDVRRPGS